MSPASIVPGVGTNVKLPNVRNIHTIRNLVTQYKYIDHVTHLKPFYYNPTFVVSLNFAVKDIDEYRRQDSGV